MDNKGVAIADSNISSQSHLSNNKDLKSFDFLESTKSLLNGNAGSKVETINGSKMLTLYQPFQVGTHTWGILLFEPYICAGCI